jgi:hypothetical protein
VRKRPFIRAKKIAWRNNSQCAKLGALQYTIVKIETVRNTSGDTEPLAVVVGSFYLPHCGSPKLERGYDVNKLPATRLADGSSDEDEVHRRRRSPGGRRLVQRAGSDGDTVQCRDQESSHGSNNNSKMKSISLKASFINAPLTRDDELHRLLLHCRLAGIVPRAMLQEAATASWRTPCSRRCASRCSRTDDFV